jgi:tRNA (mo5U34)-methyltransferase
VSGLEIDFRQLSVYEVSRIGEKFDIVLFMGVLYHLRHPLLAFDLLHDCAVGDLLVFQSLLRGSMEARPFAGDYPFTETGVFGHPDYPKLHFVQDRYTGDPTNWWIPNLSCAEAMLRSAGFEIVEHPEPELFLCRRGEIPEWSRRESDGLLGQLSRASACGRHGNERKR